MSQELKEEQSENDGFVYRTAEEMPEAIKEMIYKEWLPRVIAANLKAVRELPTEYRNHVLKGMSEGCGPMAVAVCGIKPDMTREEYIEHMTNLNPPLGPREIDWIEDLVQVSYHPPKDDDGYPVCQCPMVMLGMIEPFPELCICSANTGACFIEAYTQEPVDKVDLLGSIHSGEKTCRYRLHLKPSITSTSRDTRPCPLE